MSLTLSISVELIHLALKLGAIILLLACVAALCFICYTYGATASTGGTGARENKGVGTGADSVSIGPVHASLSFIGLLELSGSSKPLDGKET